MKLISAVRTLSAIALAATLFPCSSMAQGVAIPFVSSFAGLPTGGSGVLCTTSIPTFAIPGKTGASVGDGCVPSQASLNAPSSTAIDSFGNIYISDYGDKLIRVIYQGGSALTATLIAASPGITNFTPIPGRIYTLAGAAQATLTQTGSPSKAYYCNGNGSGTVGLTSNGDGCPATEAYIQPRGMAVDANGNLFFANLAGGNGVRVIYAGGANVASLITLLNPTVTSPQVGSVYSLASNATAGFSGDNGNARTAAFENVRDVVVDKSGNLYVSDGNGVGSLTNNDVRMINGTTGVITTVAGGTSTKSAACPTVPLFSGDGGLASSAALNSPYSIFPDASGNLYIADSCNGRLRVISNGGALPGMASSTAGYIYTIAGGGTVPGGNGVPATTLSIALLQSAGIDQAGNLYVADNTNRYVWQINPVTGIATFYGGLGLVSAVAVPAPANGAYCSGSAGPTSMDSNGDGCPSLEAAVAPSLRFVGDNQGRVFSEETGVNSLRLYSLNNNFAATAVGSGLTQPIAFSTQGTESFTLEGTSTAEFADAGGGTCATTSAPVVNMVCVYNVAFKPAQAGSRLASVRLGTTSAKLIGTGVASEASVDPGTLTTLGSGLAAQGVAVDLSGNVYVADATANQLDLFAAGGTTSTVAMSGLKAPAQVAIDGNGGLYVADAGNNRIAYKASATATVTSLGSGLVAPQGVVVDGFGNVYIADTGNSRIVELVSGSTQITMPITGLTGPTSLALDPSGDLYIADTGNLRVVELPANQSQTALGLGTLTPVGLATDAAGDLYVSDAAGLQVLEFAPGSISANTILTGLKKPLGLATDGNASLYLADAGATGLQVSNRVLGAIGFPLTNIGQSSPAPITVSDTGNAPLSFPGPQYASATGSTALYTITPASTNACSTTAATAPGANCLLTATFTPVVRGTTTETATLLTNAANNGTAKAILTGTGAQLIPTTIALTTTPSTATSVSYGTVVAVSAAVTLTIPVGTPAGTILLSIDGKAQAPVAFGSGTVGVSLNLAVGTHAVTASFSGDTVYASSNASLTFTVTKSPTTTTLTLTPSAPGGNPTVVFAAAVKAATGTGATGTVSFYSGTLLLGTTALAANAASYTATNVSFPNATFTAVYSGDANFSTSTSVANAPASDFALSSSGTTLATAQGGVATASVTITPLYNLGGTIGVSCANLPANTVCRFQPTTITLSGNTPVGVSISIYTNVSSTIAQAQPHSVRPAGSRIAMALLGPSGLALLALAFGRRRGLPIRLLTILLVLGGSFAAMAGLSGCSTNSSFTSPITAAGTQAVTVSFVSSGSAAVSHNLVFNLTVNTP